MPRMPIPRPATRATIQEVAHPKTGIYYDTKRHQEVALAYTSDDSVRELGRCSLALDPISIAYWEREIWL